MTIERTSYNGPIVFHCDGCSECDETHCSDFASALSKVKTHGWRVTKVGDDWVHLCRDCAGKG